MRFYSNCTPETVAETAVGIGPYLLDLIYSVHRDFQMPAQASLCSKAFLLRD